MVFQDAGIAITLMHSSARAFDAMFANAMVPSSSNSFETSFVLDSHPFVGFQMVLNCCRNVRLLLVLHFCWVHLVVGGNESANRMATNNLSRRKSIVPWHVPEFQERSREGLVISVSFRAVWTSNNFMAMVADSAWTSLWRWYGIGNDSTTHNRLWKARNSLLANCGPPSDLKRNGNHRSTK